MNCENYFCIYESNGKCSLESVSLNILGACDNCVYPSIDRDYLEKVKQKTLESYESEP